MYAFGLETDDLFAFVQTPEGHIYTFSSEGLAREYFNSAKHIAHLYRLDLDLSVARLLEAGDKLPAPIEVEPTESQKAALYESYPYKSLLEWEIY